MDSSVGLAIQCVGIFLVTLLSFFMMRFLESMATKYWTIAWSALSISLASLFAGFHVQGEAQHLCYSFYFFGEYSFGLMFIAGCRNHTHGARVKPKNLIVLAPFAVIAAVLPHLSADFNNLFIVQASIMAVLFAGALYQLRSALRGHVSPGVRVMSAALFLLTVDFLQYVPVFGSHQGAWGLQMPESYFRYTSIVDLILEILLGFGTMIVLMEGVRREVETANRDLTVARDRLEQIARVDPLTEALSRHAFYSLSSDNEKGAGHLAIIDIDNLKVINDTLGHAAGDAAIRAVAHALRTITRADDMFFRWGGDEFLVLMFGMPEQLAHQRLDSLNSLLSESGISVSYGLASFSAMTDLHQAIEKADETMYRNKQASKVPR